MALEHEIEDFGRRMGLANMALPQGATVALDLEDAGQVYLERTPEELLLYLARSAPAYDRDLPRRILAACHYRHAHALPFCGGMHQGQAVLITRVAERNVTTAFLENMVQYLIEQMDRIFHG
jgi:type III secretion system chaperone SycN